MKSIVLLLLVIACSINANAQHCLETTYEPPDMSCSKMGRLTTFTLTYSECGSVTKCQLSKNTIDNNNQTHSVASAYQRIPEGTWFLTEYFADGVKSKDRRKKNELTCEGETSVFGIKVGCVPYGKSGSIDFKHLPSERKIAMLVFNTKDCSGTSTSYKYPTNKCVNSEGRYVQYRIGGKSWANEANFITGSSFNIFMITASILIMSINLQ